MDAKDTSDEGGEAVEGSPADSATPAIPAAAAKPQGKKRKISRELRGFHRLERSLSRGAHRLSRAVAEGLAVYRRESRRSAAKKRDGALRDLPINTAEGMARTMRRASRVPVDVARAVDSRAACQVLRFGIRVLLWPLRR